MTSFSNTHNRSLPPPPRTSLADFRPQTPLLSEPLFPDVCSDDRARKQAMIISATVSWRIYFIRRGCDVTSKAEYARNDDEADA